MLPSGVVSVEGEFAAGEVVAVVGQVDGRELGRGLVNFDADELRKIRGAQTRQIEERLGYRSADEVIHRDFNISEMQKVVYAVESFDQIYEATREARSRLG